MVASVAPFTQRVAITLVAVSIKLSLGSELCTNDGDSLVFLQRKSTYVADNMNSSSKVVFVKTHCTGSTTLAGILIRYCDTHNATCAPPSGHGVGGNHPQLQEYVKSHKGEHMDVWPWHVRYDEKAFDQLIPGALTVSLLREPVSRLVSCMSHEDANRDYVRLMVDSLSTNGTYYGCTSTMHDQIGVLSDMDFVMLIEDYDLSLVLLARRLSWPLESLLYIRERPSEVDGSYLKVLDKFRDYMAQPVENMTENGKTFMKTCVDPDMKMYLETQQRFKRQVDRLSREEHANVQKDVARLQAANQVLEQCCTDHPADVYCLYLADLSSNRAKQRISHGLPAPAVEDARCRKRALTRLWNHSSS